MSTQTNNFARAVAAFQRKDYAEAQKWLRQSNPRQAAHLRGLVERRLGNPKDARTFLDEALKYEPRNHEIYHNQSLVYLDLGRPTQALDSVDRALSLKPDFAAAQRTRGTVLRRAGRWNEAKAHYAELLVHKPDDSVLLYGLAAAELELGEIETALERFSRLVESGSTDSAVHFMHGRAALEAGHEEVARRSLLTAHTTGPTPLTLRELARLYWMLGERKAFDELLEGPFESAEMIGVAMELLRLSGAPPGQIAAMIPADAPTAAMEAVAAQAYVDAGESDGALHHARQCLTIEPLHNSGMAALICALLMSGEAEEALRLSRDMELRQPDAQQWIAYEATALRILDPPAYAKLVDIDRHVRAFALPVPDGYASIEQFNDALIEALDRLQVFSAQPIEQSLRAGTQTARDLTTVHDPVIRTYLSALDQPIRAYMDDIGTDSSHPLSRRNTGNYRFSGCWSVRLTGGGFHVNHMHPEGWISSAYYVAVPDLDETDHSGWIKFSEPPFKTTPRLEPERWIRPSAGTLVLFPSFLWHGTAPITDDAVRVTAPFDAVPA